MEYMNKNCKETCGFCGPGSVFSLSYSCTTNSYTNDIYSTIITWIPIGTRYQALLLRE